MYIFRVGDARHTCDIVSPGYCIKDTSRETFSYENICRFSSWIDEKFFYLVFVLRYRRDTVRD